MSSESGEDRYTPIGRLTPIAWNLYDENGGLIGVGSECAPIEMCSECGAVVANQETHDEFHLLHRHVDSADWQDFVATKHDIDGPT